MTTKITKTLTGTIGSVDFKYSANGNEFATVDLRLKPDDRYGPKCRAFIEELVEQLRSHHKGDRITLEIQEEPGHFDGKPVTYRNIIGILLPHNALPPAGKPEEPPFPVPGTTPAKPSLDAPKATPAPSTPKEEPVHPKSPIDPSTVAVRSYSYSRTYNLGNFESERFEVEAQFPPGWSDAEAFAHLKERIEQARATLPADTSARAVERDRREV